MQSKLWLWLLAGIVGLAIFVRFYPSAFPEASIDFRIRPFDALQIGEQALKRLGRPDFSGYRSAVSFGWSESSKRYLEKTLGLTVANEVMRKEVGVWHFHCRWALEGSRELYFARVSPDGQILSAGMTLPEEHPGASLSERKAKAIAEGFLQTNLRLDLAQWRLVDSIQYKRPKRCDYSFIWEHRTKKFPPKAKEPATLRLTVRVAGEQIVGYSLRWLRTPQKWWFEERRRQTQRTVLMSFAGVAYGGLWLALFIVFILGLTRREAFLWATALKIAALATFVYAATLLNFAPLWWLHYDPAQPEPTFIAEQIIRILAHALRTGIIVFLLAVIGEKLSRDNPPANIPLSGLARPSFWGTKEATSGLFVGFCLGLAHLGYVVAFYLLGRIGGVWTPLDVPYTNAVATPLPFLVPLFMGLLPAIKEELFFRIAALYLLWRWTKRWWVAALISGTVWSFLHTGYPSEPAFIRGIELLPIAMLYAWSAFRYGIIAPMASHYTINAVLTALLFLRAEEPYLRLSGLLISIGVWWLFIPALVTWVRKKRLPSAHELPPIVPVAPPQPAIVAEVTYASYQPISRRTWLALIALALLGIGVRLFYSGEVFRLLPMTQINRTEAKRIAADYLRKKGVAVERYRSVASFTEELDEDEAAYVTEKANKAKLHQLWLERLPRFYWLVRFFRPLEREEWEVWVQYDGCILTFDHDIPEEAEGEKLKRKDAQSKAEAYLQKEVGVNLAEWRLVEADKRVRPKRLDHYFAYEHRTIRIGDAPLRMSVWVQGDEPQNWWAWLKIPEKWLFERDRFAAWTRLSMIWLLLILPPIVVIMIFVDWREGAIGMDWSFGIKVAIPLTLFIAISLCNNAEWIVWGNYPTSLLPAAHLVIYGLVGLLILGLIFFLVAVAFGSLAYWLKVRLPELVPLPVWLNRKEWTNFPSDTPLRHPSAWRDGILVGYLFSFAGLSIMAFEERSSVLSSFLPTLDAMVGVIWVIAISLYLGLALAGIYRYYIRTPLRLAALLLLFLPISLYGVESAKEILERLAVTVGAMAFGSAFLFWLSRKVLGYNLFGWTMSLMLPMLLMTGLEWWQVPDPFLKAQAVPLFVVYLLPAIFLLLRR